MRLGWLDPRRPAAAVLAQVTPDVAVEQLAAMVRRTPRHRVDAVMRTPARRIVLDVIFWQLPGHLDRRQATGLNTAIRWRITGRDEDDIYDLHIEDGRARVVRGGGDPVPRLTIICDATELLRIATGSSNPVNAYLNRRLSVRGDLMQVARLTALFRVPQPREADRARTRRGGS